MHSGQLRGNLRRPREVAREEGSKVGEASPPPRSQRRFIVDFTDGTLDTVAPDAAIEPIVETSAGEISDVRATRLPSGLGWRVSFRLAPDGNLPADMRLHLALDGMRLSETWSYVWYPDEVR